MRRVDSNAALLDAAAQGNTRELDVALKSGADVNTIGPRGWTALHWTAMHGYADLTTKLIEAGADPNMKTRVRHSPRPCCGREEGDGLWAGREDVQPWR